MFARRASNALPFPRNAVVKRRVANLNANPLDAVPSHVSYQKTVTTILSLPRKANVVHNVWIAAR